MAAIHRLWEELNQRIREGDNLQSQMPARTLSTRVGLPCQEMGTARGARTLCAVVSTARRSLAARCVGILFFLPLSRALGIFSLLERGQEAAGWEGARGREAAGRTETLAS